MENSSPLLHAQIAAGIFLLVLPFFYVGWRRNFFTIEQQSLLDKDLIPFRAVIGVFVAYFVFPLILVPALEFIGFDIAAFFMGIKASELKTSDSFLGWHRLLVILTGVIGVFWYMRISGVQTNFIFHRASPKSSSNSKAFLTGALTWLLAFPLVTIIGHLSAILEKLLTPDFIQHEQVAVGYLKSLQDSPLLFWSTAFLFAILVPIFEEILFRGFLQTRFRCFLKPIPAILLTSLIFTLLHFSIEQGVSNIELLSSLFVLSCFFGFLYEKKENLWASIGLHVTFNTISIALLMLTILKEKA